MPSKRLEKYLVEAGFSGNIPLNGRDKNYHAIKRLVANDAFYTFGINAITHQVKTRGVTRDEVRNVLIEASGLDVKRFRWSGPGYFEPRKSAEALTAAMQQLREASEKKQRIAFATGHPGALTGFYDTLAGWAGRQGARIVTIKTPLPVSRAYCLDMIGAVFMASDNASNWHTHETKYMETLLEQQKVDLLVGDHGFVGAALNAGIACIGIYDTDDPALPYARSLGLPITGVPMSDNCYNVAGKNLAELLMQLERG